jgi:hypothetical protein
MALPIVGAAAMAAARVVAKKLASRATGGITGAGAKQVNPVYKNQGFSEAVLKTPSYTPKNSLAKTQAKGIAKLAGAGAATGGFTQIPAVKESIKRQVQEANKNKRK